MKVGFIGDASFFRQQNVESDSHNHRKIEWASKISCD